MTPEAFFLPADPGRRFCIFYASGGQAELGAVVYVHPFAEEMNKSRRMAALQARALSAAGYAVLQIDLAGCGDSSGDFGDATWSGWVDDVVRACHWIRSRTGAPIWLWGLRSGCLVAVEAAARLRETCHFMFWQPAVSGKLLLQQFLRLKTASELIAGQAKGGMDGLRQRLAADGFVEIAGYALSHALASGLEQAELRPPAMPGRLEWIELSNRPGATLAPVSAKQLEAWQAAGFSVRSRLVNGPAFWQTTEIEEAPALLSATLAAMLEPETT